MSENVLVESPQSTHQSESYVDKKRHLWLLSVLWPATPLIGLYLVSQTGWSVWYGLVLILWYAVIPLIDAMFGEDFSNPPESAVPKLEQDRYYRVLTYLTVPMHYAALIGSAWWVSTQQVGPLEFLALALSLGIVNGLALNTGHELGHKKSLLTVGWPSLSSQLLVMVTFLLNTIKVITETWLHLKIQRHLAWVSPSMLSPCVKFQALLNALGLWKSNG